MASCSPNSSSSEDSLPLRVVCGKRLSPRNLACRSGEPPYKQIPVGETGVDVLPNKFVKNKYIFANVDEKALGVRQRGVCKASYLSYWGNMSIVSVVLLSVSFSAFIGGEPEVELEDVGEGSIIKWALHMYLLVWCFCVFCQLFAAVAFVMLIGYGSFAPSDADFNDFVFKLGRWVFTPELLTCAGGVALYLGFVIFLFLQMGMRSTALCVGFCFVSAMLPLLMFSVKMVRIGTTLTSENGFTHLSDGVYSALLEYYMVEKRGDFLALDKDEFVSKFGKDEPMLHRLAARVFEHWVEQKMSDMLRPHPGF